MRPGVPENRIDGTEQRLQVEKQGKTRFKRRFRNSMVVIK
jgi:hypothetical protein